MVQYNNTLIKGLVAALAAVSMAAPGAVAQEADTAPVCTQSVKLTYGTGAAAPDFSSPVEEPFMTAAYFANCDALNFGFINGFTEDGHNRTILTPSVNLEAIGLANPFLDTVNADLIIKDGNVAAFYGVKNLEGPLGTSGYVAVGAGDGFEPFVEAYGSRTFDLGDNLDLNLGLGGGNYNGTDYVKAGALFGYDVSDDTRLGLDLKLYNDASERDTTAMVSVARRF